MSRPKFIYFKCFSFILHSVELKAKLWYAFNRISVQGGMAVSLYDFLFKNLSWLFLTNHCIYCNEVVGYGENLCQECREELPRISGARCRLCGAGKERCDCKNHRMAYDGITSPFYYEGGVQRGIRKLKFNGKDHLAHHYAEAMAECVKADFSEVDFDFICYVPFTNLQKLKRSYNTSELLAEELAKFLKLPLSREIYKLFETDTQHRKGVVGRKGNVFGVYDVRHPEKIKDKTVLLVDDIKTTGVTLDECAWILKIRGARAVYCVTAALTGNSKQEKSNSKEVEK